jgi:hypothetical protein
MMEASKRSSRREEQAVREYAWGLFIRVGLFSLALDLVGLAVVVGIFWQDGPGQVPAIFVGGAIGE